MVHTHTSQASFEMCAECAEDEQHVIYMSTVLHQPCHLTHVMMQGTQGTREIKTRL
jgi:hypothetical protein